MSTTVPSFFPGQPGQSVPLQVSLTPLGPSTPQGQIYVDPQNVTGIANDLNPPSATPAGQTVAGPVFRTWKGLVAAWGTLFPVFNVTTTAVFLSSHTDTTDPVVLFPLLIGPGISFVIRGTATIVATVNLSGVVAKSRVAGANSLLQANLGASAAQGMFVQNQTHVANCWVYKALGANNFSLSQPMAPQSTGASTQPSEVDTFANGDVVNLVTFTQINITCLVATSVDGFGPSGFGEIQQCVILTSSPSGPCALGQNTIVRETSCQRIFINALETAFAPALTNCLLLGANAGVEGIFSLRGGAAVSGLFGLGGSGVTSALVDGDFILGTPFPLFKGNVQAGTFFLDNPGGTSSLGVFEGQVLAGGSSYGNPPIWYGAAGANIKVVRNGRITIGTGNSFTTQWTAPGLVSPGILINGSSTAESHTNAAPDVINGGIATTVANLDAAAGATGFGGSAFNLSTGAGVSNQNT